MNVVILIKSIMLRGCVIIVIINLEEIRNPGYAVMKNYMHVIKNYIFSFYLIEGLCQNCYINKYN